MCLVYSVEKNSMLKNDMNSLVVYQDQVNRCVLVFYFILFYFILLYFISWWTIFDYFPHLS